MLSVAPLPPFKRDLDCLQTRSRRPRNHPPNFALLCDWVIWQPGQILGRDHAPETIFLRTDESTLRWFTEEVLPELSSRFVLVTGSHDRPMPLGWADHAGLDWEQILRHPNLTAWFTENRDVEDSRVRPLTLGIPCPDLSSWIDSAAESGPWDEETFAAARGWRAETRPDSVFGCWRDRSDHSSGTSPRGADERSRCRTQLVGQPFFHWTEPVLSHREFIRELRRHRFVACPHGGGLDPSPRAWEALHVGTIPIIKRSSVSDAFVDLPVVIVEDWAEVTTAALTDWNDEHRPAIESDRLEYLLSNQALFDRINQQLP